MESSDEELSEDFIKNISKPILNAEEFLKENGIVLPSETPGSRKTEALQQDEEHDAEVLNNLCKALSEKLNLGKEDLKRNVPDIKNSTSLVNIFFAPKDGEPSRKPQHTANPSLDSFLLNDGIEFLSETFPQFDPSTLSSKINVGTRQAKRTADIVELFSLDKVPSGELSKGEVDAGCSSDPKLERVTEANQDENKTDIPIPEYSSTGKGKKEKKKSDKKNSKKSKDKECEYEKLDIDWLNPREDIEFTKELEEMMGCGKFKYDGKKTKPKPILNKLCVEPVLPRDIGSILTSANETTFANWEYSVKLEHNELTSSDESDIEDMIEMEKSNLLKGMSKAEQKIEANKDLQCNASFDPSCFLQNLMPHSCEEFVAVRDDEGNIISYENVQRDEANIIEEYEQTYTKVESDSDDDDEEVEPPEDDPEAKVEEIDFKQDKIREGDHEAVDVPQEELLENMEKVEALADILKDSNVEEMSDLKFKKEILSVDKLLDSCGVPRAMDIEDLPLNDIIAKELDMINPLKIAHKNVTCPPGQLEGVCSSDDEDYNRFKNINMQSFMEEFKSIARPKELTLNILENIDSKDDNITENSPEQGTETIKLEEQILEGECSQAEGKEETSPEEEESKHEDENVEIEESLHEIAAESDDESYPDSSDADEEEEEEEKLLDEAFVKEYFRRGGSAEGLGEYSFPTPNGSGMETLESYKEKYCSYPFFSQQTTHINMVRMRRTLAEYLPELEEEAFADLSKDLDVEISEPELSSSDDSTVEYIVDFQPTGLDDFEKTCTVDDSYEFPKSAAEGTNFHPVGPHRRTYEDLINEVKETRKKKLLARKQRAERKLEESESRDVEEEGEGEREPMFVTWKPFEKFKQPSPQDIVNTLGQVNKIIKPPSIKFKKPKGVSAWVKGEYVPSKEELMQWKTHYMEHYGKSSMLDEVLSSENQALHEELVEIIDKELKSKKHKSKEDEEIDEHLDATDVVNDNDNYDADADDDDEDDDITNESNFLIKFKMVLEKENLSQDPETEGQITNDDSADIQEIKAEESIDRNDLQQKEEAAENEKESVLNEEIDKDKEEDHNNGEEGARSDDSSEVEPKEPADFLAVGSTETSKDGGVVTVVRLRDTQTVLKKEEWAEEVNCNKDIELNFPPALTYSFELDGFQKQAIAALERGFNVFVSAHTSAGKTVVAEYAIAMSKRNRSRAIYTSPVKALSNQKYADFKKLFGSVGLITGDIQLNENAECLIMTTEILRSMLYNCSEKIRDLQYVIFDEVHYINDPERGHVWEEVLILLSSQVQIVMLSATVPNTMEFANWVGRTKQRKVVVCATQHRPVPLNHYLYTGTGGPSPGDTYLLKSGNGNFLLQNYLKAEAVMKDNKDKEWATKKKLMIKKKEAEWEWKKKGQTGPPPMTLLDDPNLRSYRKDQTMWVALIAFLKKKDWLPAVVFVFSRMKCDSFAQMLSTIDLTTKSEKSFIHKFIKSQIEKLDEVDQDLPQIQEMKMQLDKGIGIHHSGILPVMKEIVEVLFQEGKVKLLFATETFAMGVNMPARTVIFHSIRKFDGNETRLLLPAEYVQMAGRAGRRGKDAAGNVLILAKPTDIIPRHSLETLLFGNPCKLTSKFRLTYRMILNTLTVSGMLTVQNMMEQSYCENQGQLKRTFIEKDLIEAELREKELQRNMTAKVSDLDVESLSQFFDDAKAYIEKWNELRYPMLMQSRLIRELFPGRLIKICQGAYVNRIGALVAAELIPDDPSRNSYKVLVLQHSKEHSKHIAPDDRNLKQHELDLWFRMVSLMNDLPPELEIVSSSTDYTILTVKYINIVGIYRECLKLQKGKLEEFDKFLKRRGTGMRKQDGCDVGDSIARLLYAQSRKATEIDEKLLSAERFELVVLSTKLWELWETLQKSTVSSRSHLVMEAFRRVFSWKLALDKVNHLKSSMSVENMSLYPDFINKLGLLKEKGYISDSEQVLMKGYMAARIGKYELIVCEMLFENVLVDLSAEEVAALLSFLVYQNSSDDVPLNNTLPLSLRNAVEKCKKIMLEVTTLEKSYDIRDFDGSEISKLKFGLVPVMYAWAKQEPLKKIMEMELEVDFQEGMLVRWIQQLLETLKEVEAAARLMGDPLVPEKLQAAGQSIKRGIVFAPSLYTTLA